MDWLKQQVEWVKGFFQEPDGKASMKRLIMLMISAAFLSAYVKIAVGVKEMVDIPMNWAFLISGILGLGILDKYVTMRNGKGNGGSSSGN